MMFECDEHIAELEADRDHQLRARKDLEGVIRKRNRRIAELEAEVANLKAIMRGDGGTEKVEVSDG
jgi:hypothetical protein